MKSHGSGRIYYKKTKMAVETHSKPNYKNIPKYPSLNYQKKLAYEIFLLKIAIILILVSGIGFISFSVFTYYLNK